MPRQPHARHCQAANPRAPLHRRALPAGTGLRWTDFHGIQLPVSAKDGPRHTRGGLAWGFADTPGGALLAAVNIAVRTAAQWGPAIYQPTIRHQVTGPDTAALLAADTSDYAALRAAAHVRPGQPAGRGYAVEAGYRFVAYTPGRRHGRHRHRGPRQQRDDRAGRHPDRRSSGSAVTGGWSPRPAATGPAPPPPVSSLTGYTTFPNEG